MSIGTAPCENIALLTSYGKYISCANSPALASISFRSNVGICRRVSWHAAWSSPILCFDECAASLYRQSSGRISSRTTGLARGACWLTSSRMICLNSSATTTLESCSGQCKQGQASLRILARQQRRHSFNELKSISSSCSTQSVSWHIAEWEEMPNKKKFTGGRFQICPGGTLDVFKRLIAFEKLFEGLLEIGN